MRRLSLKREPLAELRTDELSAVNGAALPSTQCFTGYYPSINAPCTTLVTTAIAIDHTPLCPTE